jgi:transcriptional regulator with XRE-family HTH domain
MRVADLKKAVGRGVKVVRGTRAQGQFAGEHDISQQGLSKYERGIMPGPFLRFLYNIHVYEGVDLNKLVRGEIGRENGR